MSHAEPWIADAQAFPLSPSLPLDHPAADWASAPIKRFIEHLPPGGHALDVAVAYNDLAKTSVFALNWAWGAETVAAVCFSGDAAAAQPGGNPIL
jgi:serine/threonine-protein kinase HipA